MPDEFVSALVELFDFAGQEHLLLFAGADVLLSTIGKNDGEWFGRHDSSAKSHGHQELFAQIHEGHPGCDHQKLLPLADRGAGDDQGGRRPRCRPSSGRIVR